ncbi:Dyp-type peroxidase [Allostreptomyces psammosilenae]|uniref:Dye decolorizing peroxidase/deferrochelatase/peroxidase EfeB n=1 Tax=Allostreptomyces psammosilenae TaxID=1892865 RepID=A0A853A1J8_9ACTN|nr:Dyp-type peroxidase [Allostreptomyces psammosilenae]NYI04671.1 dye decolorizing peroxidase/deferrochelatase/peroxidase EfeB [Allostreptomyces psammosilenae]
MPERSASDRTSEPTTPATASFSRRALIASFAATAGVAGVSGALVAEAREPASPGPHADAGRRVEPFHGAHQPGIATAQQRYALFAAFDLETADPRGGRLPADRVAANFAQIMERWTVAAERLMRGEAPGPIPANVRDAPADTGIADGLAPAGLTLTFGLGPDLFDRIGRPEQRPRRLRALPAFAGDQLQAAWSGGELLVQICGDDPQVLSHAFRAIRGRTPGLARLRWSQQGFLGRFGDGTPRNLFGHKDGTANPRAGTTAFDDTVWVTAPDEPAWFSGGTYLVFRKIRMDLPKWDTSTAQQQDRSIGRRRDTGAPLSGGDEFTAPDFERAGPDGTPAIPPDSHVALVRGAPMLRRSYNYDYAFPVATGPSGGAHDHGGDGPGHSHGDHPHDHAAAGHDSYDSGTLFCAFLRDPGEFVRAQRALAESDRLNAFIRHTGSAVFAVPPGIRPGQHLAAPLFPPR